MKQKKEVKTVFKCVHCKSDFVLDYTPPEVWTVRRYADKGNFVFTCANCGAFIYPVDLCGNRSPDEDVFFMFSNCVNAWQCYLHDRYSPQCEKQVLTPNCLSGIYTGLKDLDARLGELEKRLLEKQPDQTAKTGEGKSRIKLN